MSRRLWMSALIVVLACLTGVREAHACWSCSSGKCKTGMHKADCEEMVVDGKFLCVVSGDVCTPEGGGGGQEGALVAGGDQMRWVVFMTANDAAINSVLPTGRDRVEGEIAGEAPSDLLARVSGQSASSFAVSGAVLLYGSGSRSLRTAFGDVIKLRLAPSRGSSSGRSNAGGNGASIVVDRALGSNEVLITQVTLSGQRYLAITGVRSFAGEAILEIVRQEFLDGLNRSQQGLSLRLTGE